MMTPGLAAENASNIAKAVLFPDEFDGRYDDSIQAILLIVSH
jgi:hypothetical protein